MNVVVVIPVFNGARTIRRAVESVTAQKTQAAVSILCMDDASTDGSVAILRELASTIPGMRLEQNPVNLGVSATRNRAIGLSDEEYVAFLDQDDEWVPDKLERQLEVFAENPDVGFVVGLQQFVLDPGESLPAWVRPEWFREPQRGYVPGALIARRSLFEHIGTFDESMRIGGDDTDWFARSRRRKIRSVHLESVVMLRHVHGRNLSSDVGTSKELLALVRRHVRERGSA